VGADCTPDKVYKPKNLVLAWERVWRNKGAGGVDGETLKDFEAGLEERLARLHAELKADDYCPQPVRQKLIPKPGQPGKMRPPGIPTIYDRMCQQALLNRLEPIFEPVFDDADFGYRRGRSTKDAISRRGRGHQPLPTLPIFAKRCSLCLLSPLRPLHKVQTTQNT